MAVESGTVQVVMPAMGDSVAEGTVLEWRKQIGDRVEVDETLVEISTDKVDAEVPAPAGGTITEILVDEGDTVTVGQTIARMRAGEAAVAPSVRERAEKTTPGVEKAELADGAKASPVARRVAAQEGVDLAAVDGSGPGG